MESFLFCFQTARCSRLLYTPGYELKKRTMNIFTSFVCLVNLRDQVDMDEMKDFFTRLSPLWRLATGQPSFLLSFLFFSFLSFFFLFHSFIHSFFYSSIHPFIRLLDWLMNIWMCYCCVDFKRRGHTNKRDAQEEKWRVSFILNNNDDTQRQLMWVKKRG